MSVDIFMHVDGIKGESTDKTFKNEIELLSFEHSLQQSSSKVASTAGGGTSGRVSFGDFYITKLVDIASPLFFKFCASGQHVNAIWVKLRRAGGQQHVYYEYHFENCIITSVEKSNMKDSNDGFPKETIKFNFSSMKEIYHKQDRAGGGLSGSVEAGWNLIDNSAM